jgi:S1-C subfamily serine protease
MMDEQRFDPHGDPHSESTPNATDATDATDATGAAAPSVDPATNSYPQPTYAPPGYPTAAHPTASYPTAAYPPVGQSHYQPGFYQGGYGQPGQYGQGGGQYGQYAQYGQYGYPPVGYPWTAPLPAGSAGAPGGSTPVRSRRRRVIVTSAIAAVIAAACVAGVVTTSSSLNLTGHDSAASTIIPGNGNSGSSGSSGSGNSGGLGSGNSGGFGSGSGSGSGTGTGSGTSNGTANATQEVGVVDIVTQLKYQNAEAAGTGMVLTSSGEILTNNHVVDGATSISVTVVSTGKTYTATVVGTDPTQDIAVLKLSNASGLQTAKISTSAKVAVGDAVTAVGNAGGTGGTPSTASGTVTALNQSITATDEDGSNSENLTGLIESNAPIAAGDSGGPLYNASGEIIGIDTAGSSGSSSPRGFSATTLTQAYSIPITTAISIADQIEAGKASSTIHLGYPPFLGVEISASNTSGSFGGQTTTGTGAVVSGVVDGTPAASAGLAEGDTITAVGSTTITSQADLQTALAQYKAGQSVKISWTDASGQSHTATVTLIQGPAD